MMLWLSLQGFSTVFLIQDYLLTTYCWPVQKPPGIRPVEIPALPPVDTIGCGNWVNLTVGIRQWISSHDYPSKYPPDTNCVWKVTAPFSSRVKLTFEHFVMQPGHFQSCFADYFSIEDAGHTIRYCGIMPRGRSILSNVNQIELRFVSDSTWEEVGFRISLETVPNGRSATIVNMSQGIISSPNYPFPYLPNTVCSWRIHVPIGQRVLLDCHEPFLLEGPPGKCFHDYLSVSITGDESFKKNKRFCWSQGPQRLTSVRNVMTVLFRSNAFHQAKGFRCEFKYAKTKTTYIFPQSPLEECKCGVINESPKTPEASARIVGGTEVTPNTYPWMVVIFLPPGILGCGGSIISDRYVLTASHCFLRVQQPNLLRVAIGQHDLTKLSQISGQIVDVERVIVHPNFDKDTSLNDIALLRLAQSITFSQNVLPICLPRLAMKLENRKVKAVGWGRTSTEGQFSNVLREVDLRVKSNQDCQKSYPNVITDEMLCAGNGSKDACQGDSGGPLMLEEGEIIIQVGIVSYGLECGAYEVPGVYTRVDQHLDFIARHTLRSDHCVPLKENKNISKTGEIRHSAKSFKSFG